MEKKYVLPKYFKRLSEICSDEDIVEMDKDVHNGVYKKWLEKYPFAIFDVLKKYLFFGKELTEKDFITFKKFGMRYEVLYDYNSIFNCDCNVFFFLAENRRYYELKVLLKTEKSSLDYVNDKGYNIFECAIMGVRLSTENEFDDTYRVEQTLYVIEQNLRTGMKINPWILDTYCKEYINLSPYIRDLVKTCDQKFSRGNNNLNMEK